MRTGLKLATMLTLLVCLDACALYQPLDGPQFKHVFYDQQQPSDQSWWAVGEDADFYYLKSHSLFEDYYYKVPKRDISIDLGPSPIFPVNLKWDAVKIFK